MAEIRVFLNERCLTVPPASTVREVLAAALPDLLPAITGGTAFVTDGRGLPIALDAVLPPGAILRAARSGRRSEAEHGGT